MAVRLKDRIEANIRQSDKVNSSLSIQLNSGTATVYNGSAAKNINITPETVGVLTKWTAKVAYAAWSRLCYVNYHSSVTGCNFILQFEATRNAVVYNETYLVIAHHSSSGRLVKLNGSKYSSANGLQVRLLANSEGSCYIEIYDACNSNTAAGTIQNVRCTFIPIRTGALTPYTDYTSSATLPSGFSVVQTINTFVDADLQGTIDKAIAASSVNGVIPEWAGSVSWNDTGWIAAWNADGTKIKALNKNSFAPASHSHSYLPLSGGTITGSIEIANGNRWPQLGFATNDNGTFKHIGLLYMDDGSDAANEMNQSVMAFRAYSWNSSTKKRSDYYEDFYLRASADITATRGYDIFSTKNYTSYVPTRTGSGASGTWGINITGNAATSTLATSVKDSGDGRTLYMNYSAPGMSSTSWLGSWNGNTLQAIAPSVLSVGSAGCLVNRSDVTYGWNGLQYFNASLGTTASSTSNYAPTADWYHIIRMNHGNANGYYVELAACFHSDNFYFRRVASGTNSGFKHIWVEGNSVTSAVWNDYAEYRESDCQEFGRVLVENGDDSLSVSTKRLQPFAGISSDTWGFCQGETEKAKTPIAVAGRVLAYPYQNRNNYKPGDCVCAAPNGTVDIMTRQEVIQYPDRIVGTVSCIPDYEEWGQGDRPAVKVDGRIWIKVR